MTAPLSLELASFTHHVPGTDTTIKVVPLSVAQQHVAYAEGLKDAAISLLDGASEVQDNGLRYVTPGDLDALRAALQSPSQGGECAGLAPPAGCRWPKTCGAQLAEAAVREEGVLLPAEGLKVCFTVSTKREGWFADGQFWSSGGYHWAPEHVTHWKPLEGA